MLRLISISIISYLTGLFLDRTTEAEERRREERKREKRLKKEEKEARRKEEEEENYDGESGRRCLPA